VVSIYGLDMNIAFVYMNNEKNVGRGAGYVAGAIINAGYKLKFYDTLYSPIDTISHDIVHEKFDIFMISSMTMLFPEAIKLICMVKEKKNIPVLVGGVHPTIEGRSILEQYKQIDFICIGEGESMAIDFLHSFGTDSLFGVQNLAYRRNGIVHANPSRPPEDLSKLPPFPWEFFPNESIVQQGLGGFLYVTASRGCPYNCTYCSNGIYLKQYGKNYLRFKPIVHVIEELKFLNKKYSPRLFYFGDEMILSYPEKAVELFVTIKRELNVPYGFMCRVEYISPELVDVLKRTGCQYASVGIECGNEAFRLKYLNRKMSNQQIEYAFSMLKKANIFTTSFNMIGYPFDNDDYLTEETIRLNKKIRPNNMQVSIFYPFPGTKLYERCIKMDLIDIQKMKNTKEYFSESVLKGVSLRKKIKEINSLFNPHGFIFAFEFYRIKREFGLKKLIYLIEMFLRSKAFIRKIINKLPRSIKSFIKLA